MNTCESLYCQIFLNTELNKSDIIKGLENLLNTKSTGNVIALESVEIELRDNESFEQKLCKEATNRFLYFPYYIEVDPFPEQTQENQIDLVSKILEYSWSSGFEVVASCDYEEQLPNSGGYKQKLT
ncbi:hypothetical protein [Limnoraphis robusta]|uniref:1,4-dihydroxy-6-naphthoate synthase n=1 Tax=Limnoraphis robusta CS-951 TaxID=1637645 RepID=A0A0F5YK81_9CYAN|nr:hypothetical protein [Limnoraphis robusta]KKD39168.1 hypothetical protein WN50_04860 [Limnoraphis robusta CS-951]